MTETAEQPDVPFRREIRSFVRREGRMTDAQKRALDDLWPQYGVEMPAAPLDLTALFGRDAPRVFEIGFGMGDYLHSRVVAEPQRDFFGVEVHRPGVGRLLHRVASAGARNLRVACDDAVVLLRDGIPDAALDEIVIQFPDPWHKARHNKRRLIQPAFAALAVRKLKPDGLLSLATDWAPYAEHMLDVLNAEPGLRNLSETGTYVPRPATRLKTKFEARGERLGHEVFDLAFARR
ncbi:tRNA (guanosine(46)-N7)-methyltransferase TrmB [Solimonas sp. C16B3]|uniref:tRNA (guanine-N(7)-)-methyltransferase n=1 Tax=Solimonas marina TaxID=2714601 RepID=A0A969WEC2_9GAMM|nr:tRNA (guanosine(46)-N7)-methyltransferase TrmB [Solimonas marina]NKF24550.1 tRNA (guanosine(46)-N7)-methyltransferase TrmB [Solimonas marina]